MYLGNYKVDLPKELIPSWPRTVHINTNKEKDFISSLIDSYCRFNLRKSIFFTEEGIEKYKKWVNLLNIYLILNQKNLKEINICLI